MTSRERILALLKEHGELTPFVITDYLQISKQRVHRLLKELISIDKISKYGSAPKVVYRLNESTTEQRIPNIADEEGLSHFLLINARGNMLEGLEAFAQWCKARNLPFEKTKPEYLKTTEKYESYRGENGLINGTVKLQNTKGLSLCIDEQYYADFYAIERFGKTRLGQLVHFGKMSQSKKLIAKIVEETSEHLKQLINTLNIDAIGYIPPTLYREVQIMKELRKLYNIPKPILEINKVKGEIIVPQKALSKLKDRIENAQLSIQISDQRVFNKVLLIDDALGSGATINETACKLKNRHIAKMVYGYALTGSYKGFEVISEA